MQIFYFRKNTLKWMIAIVVIVILAFIIWRIFGMDSQQSQGTLMVAQLNTILN